MQPTVILHACNGAVLAPLSTAHNCLSQITSVINHRQQNCLHYAPHRQAKQQNNSFLSPVLVAGVAI